MWGCTRHRVSLVSHFRFVTTARGAPRGAASADTAGETAARSVAAGGAGSALRQVPPSGARVGRWQGRIRAPPTAAARPPTPFSTAAAVAAAVGRATRGPCLAGAGGGTAGPCRRRRRRRRRPRADHRPPGRSGGPSVQEAAQQNATQNGLFGNEQQNANPFGCLFGQQPRADGDSVSRVCASLVGGPCRCQDLLPITAESDGFIKKKELGGTVPMQLLAETKQISRTA